MAIVSVSKSTLPAVGEKGRSIREITGLVPFTYLIIAGGGSAGPAGFYALGGGGAGGYRTNKVGDTSGGGSPAEPIAFTALNVATPIRVGAGGSNPSYIGPIISLGGGAGGLGGSTGGSGGGKRGNTTVNPPGINPGTAGQGTPGGEGSRRPPAVGYAPGSTPPLMGAGGGGASAPGVTPVPVNGGTQAGPGGDGLLSSMGTPGVYRGGGGGGGLFGPGSRGLGGLGGGGAGGTGSLAAVNGVANTGGGGGGKGAGPSPSFPATVGGSGFIILQISDEYTATFSPGVTYTGGSPSGGLRTYEITAAGPTDTFTLS